MAKTFRGNEYLGIRIPTLFGEADARRCAGCGRHIDGRPFRVTILDIVSTESPVAWDAGIRLNPGPHQFHSDPACVKAWIRDEGFLLCRLSGIADTMRPIALPGSEPRWGLCDGVHREAHELIPA